MLETFKAQLKAKSKAAGANLSQKRIDAIADRLHTKFPDLTEQAEHDAKIDDLYIADDFKDFAAADDHARAKAAKEKKDKEDKDKLEKDAAEVIVKAAEQVGEPQPSWLKGLTDQISSLKGDLDALKTEKQTVSINTKLTERLKDVPGAVWAKRIKPVNDEEVETFISDVVKDWGEINPGAVNIGDSRQQNFTKRPVTNVGATGKEGVDKPTGMMNGYLARKDEKNKAATLPTVK